MDIAQAAHATPEDLLAAAGLYDLTQHSFAAVVQVGAALSFRAQQMDHVCELKPLHDLIRYQDAQHLGEFTVPHHTLSPWDADRCFMWRYRAVGTELRKRMHARGAYSPTSQPGSHPHAAV